MIPVLLAVFLGFVAPLFGGGALIYDISEPVKEYVQDKETAKQIITINEAMLEEVDLFVKDFAEAGKSLAELNGNRSTTDDEFQAVFTALELQRADIHEQILDGRFQMKELMTVEEWNQVFSDPPKE